MLDTRLLLSGLDLSDAEIDIYLAMLQGALVPREIVKATGRSRPTVYYALGALERRGLLSQTGMPDDRRYRVEPLDRLKLILQQKEDNLSDLQTQLAEFVRQHEVRPQADRKPHISFYEGVSAVRNVVMESLYSRGQHIDSLVPSDNFFWQLGPGFVEQYVEMRHTLGISTRNLWGKGVNQEIIEEHYGKAQIRMLPQGMGDRFRTTVFMYDDSVLYISSLASGYALIVRSAEHIEMMQLMYEVLWGQGKPLG